ncbi:MAG: phage/plasmid replication protein, II/X family [Desulfuromonadales bacterium]|nr:phage/plasmid replication protein, II/X family [Desulfuromonadales bacterium]
MHYMVDWLSFTVPYNGPDICGDRTITFEASGEIKFEKASFKAIEGSFSKRVMVKTIPLDTGNGLYISGNPAKFLQGHNLFGPFDVVGLAYDMSLEICKTLQICDLRLLSDIRRGAFDLKRIDVTASYRLPSTSDVRAWLKHATVFASGKSQSVTDFRGKTLYFGQHSQRVTLKFYSKADDKYFRADCELFVDEKRQFLEEFAQGILRAELTLRGRKLKEMGIHRGHHWDSLLAQGVYNMHLDKVNLCGEYELEDEDVKNIPARYRAAYELYKQGKLLSELYSRATYYRYKKYFLESYGINVDVPRVQERGNVIPLIRVLRAEPLSIPAEAFDLGLVHNCSTK